MTNHTQSDTTPSKATIREWVGLAVLALGAFLYVMDLTVLHLAIPTISEELKPTSAQLLWIIDIYGFMVAGFLVTMGTLGDRIGRRKLLMIGAALFGVFSLLAAFAKTSEMLIASRALLGIAGATLGPSTLSLIFSMFKDQAERSRAIGVWISAFSAGSAVGPILGGILLEHFWWGSVFLLAVPVMLLLLILGPIVLPEYKDPKEGRLDLLSAGMAIFSVLLMIYGLKQIAQDGFGIGALAASLAGVGIGIVFVKRQFTLKDPMIDVKLFLIPAFRAALTVNFLAVLVSIGYFLFVAQYLQLVLGMTPLVAGMWSVPSALGFIIGSNIAPRLVAKFKAEYLISVCLVIAACGLGVFTQVGGIQGFFAVIAASVIISLGLGPVFGLTTELIVGSAPPERAGAASGISETAAELGGALGISILGSIGVAIYRGSMATELPAGIPTDLVKTAQDTLGAAVIVAGELPRELGIPLLTVARNAFVHGMQVVGVISMILAIFAALLSLAMLRQARKDKT
jgi:MFS transporter, DHA2 family, multidrug resistance protein